VEEVKKLFQRGRTIEIRTSFNLGPNSLLLKMREEDNSMIRSLMFIWDLESNEMPCKV